MVLLFLVIFSELGASRYANQLQTDIREIYIAESYWGRTYAEYRLVFTEKLFYVFRESAGIRPTPTPSPRNQNTVNEGYQSITPLEPDKIHTFLMDAVSTGLFDLKDYKINGWDYPDCTIIIYRSDGTSKKYYCYGDYPDDWKNVMPIFKKLTGEDLFQ